MNHKIVSLFKALSVLSLVISLYGCGSLTNGGNPPLNDTSSNSPEANEQESVGMGQGSMEYTLNHNEDRQGADGHHYRHHQRASVSVILRNPSGRDVSRDQLYLSLNQGVVSVTIHNISGNQYQVHMISQETQNNSENEQVIRASVEVFVL